MAETLKEKTAKGLFWGGLSNVVQQLLNLVFGIFLARMLSQSDYGMVGMLAIFSAIANALQEGGFISALNRKKDASHKDYNAVFWFSTSVSLLLYVILFFSAPLIARFYGVPELTSLARIIFVAFFLSSVAIVPGAIIYRNLMVREAAIVTLSSQALSGIVAICLAANGFAYWGIAMQTIVYVVVVLVMRFHFSKWRPTLSVDFSPIREMFGYGSKLMITDIFVILNNNLFSVLLGRMYSPREVGNYTQANKWNGMGIAFIGGMIWRTAQPVFAKTDDDIDRQKRVFRKLLRFTTFVSFPAMFGLALVAEEFIVILLTEKWLESARMMQILCVSGAFAPASSLLSCLIVARGHSTTHMWCNIVQCLAQILAVCVSAPYGIYRMIQVYVVINVLWFFVWYYFGRREIKIGLLEVLKDISPYLLLSLFLVKAASMLTASVSNLYLSFTIKVSFVAVGYCLTLWCLKSTILKEVILFLTKRKIE